MSTAKARSNIVTCALLIIDTFFTRCEVVRSEAAKIADYRGHCRTLLPSFQRLASFSYEALRCQGGYVLPGVCLSVCLFVSNFT